MKRKINNEEENYLNALINGEESSRYGEFISSYFAWLSLSKQKARANELNDITKKK